MKPTVLLSSSLRYTETDLAKDVRKGNTFFLLHAHLLYLINASMHLHIPMSVNDADFTGFLPAAQLPQR